MLYDNPWSWVVVDFSVEKPVDICPKPIDLPVVIDYSIGNIQDLFQDIDKID
jgi:hypothetical protein